MNSAPAETAGPLVGAQFKLSSKFTNVVKAVVLLWWTILRPRMVTATLAVFQSHFRPALRNLINTTLVGTSTKAHPGLVLSDTWVLTWVNILTIFSDIIPCNTSDMHRRFRGTHYLHHQRKFINKTQASSKQWLFNCNITQCYTPKYACPNIYSMHQSISGLP